MGTTIVEISGGGGGTLGWVVGGGGGLHANAKCKMLNAKTIRAICFCILHSAFCIRMKYVNLGTTGLKVPRLCLVCMTYGSSKWRSWILDADAAPPFFVRAREAGVSFLDTAGKYSNVASEEVTGGALRDLTRRDE